MPRLTAASAQHMKTLRAIIVDFDGVLVESSRIKDEAFRAVFSTYPNHAADAYNYHRNNLTQPRDQKFRHLVETLLQRSGDEALIHALSARFSSMVTNRIGSAPEVPGSTRFLKRFSEGIPIFVASVTPQAELEHLLRVRGWSPYVRRCYGDPPTPKPRAVARALEEAACFPEDAVVVGDAPSDLAAARLNGVPFLGRDSGIPFPGETLRLAQDMDEIYQIMEEQIGAAPHA